MLATLISCTTAITLSTNIFHIKDSSYILGVGEVVADRTGANVVM